MRQSYVEARLRVVASGDEPNALRERSWDAHGRITPYLTY